MVSEIQMAEAVRGSESEFLLCKITNNADQKSDVSLGPNVVFFLDKFQIFPLNQTGRQCSDVTLTLPLGTAARNADSGKYFHDLVKP